MDNDVRLQAMDSDRFDVWKAGKRAEAVDGLVSIGSSPDAVTAMVDLSLDNTLRSGDRAHRLWSLHAGDVEIGTAWVRMQDQPAGLGAYVYDLEVAAEHSNPTVGSQTVEALERAVAEEGAVSLQLKARVGDQGEYEKRGYDVVLFEISKPVAGVPPTVYPDAREVQLRPMTQEQFDAYARDWQSDLAAHLTESTDASPDVALESARGQFEQLAHGPLRPRKQAFLVGYHEDEPIGRIWLVLEDRPDGLHAFVNDLRVDSTIQGKGFGRSMMAANYQHLRDIGVVRVRGRVYGANQHALAIFERADYRVTDVHLKKELSSSN